MSEPKYMQCKANGTVVPFDADLFKSEKYVPYIPEEHAPKADKPAPKADKKSGQD